MKGSPAPSHATTAQAPVPRSAGRAIVDALRLHGVDRIFCVPGESYLTPTMRLAD